MSEFSKLTWLRESRPIIRTLTTTQRDVLDVIFDHANPDGTNAFRSQEQIAEAIGKRERQVRNVLGQLRELGLIVRTERGNRRLGKADVYALGSPAISDHRQSKVAGNDADGITGTPTLPVKPETEADYRQSADALPAISGVITGNPALPPNRPCTPDPGPIDPGIGKGEDDPRGESEHSAEFASCTQPGDYEPDPFRSDSPSGGDAHRRIADPFASLPSGSSAQGDSWGYSSGEHETSSEDAAGVRGSNFSSAESSAGSDDPEPGEPESVPVPRRPEVTEGRTQPLADPPSEQNQAKALELGERLSNVASGRI
ncbi:helix-turn-helix domain-containing protein, partial [Mycobacterium avium]